MPSSSSVGINFLSGSRNHSEYSLCNCGDGLNGVGAANGFRACFGKTEVLHFALLNQLLYRAGDVFDGHFEIDAMLIEEIDGVGLEALERSLRNFFDVLRAAIERARWSDRFEPKLGGDRHLFAKRREGFAHQFFVDVSAVDFGCVEEGDA